MKIDGLVGTVIGSAVNGPATLQQAFEGDGQLLTRRVVDGEVVEAGHTAGGWGTATASPRVQADVVVVATRRQEGCLVPQTRHQVEAHYVAVEPNGPLQVGDLEVHVTDPSVRGNGSICHN